MLGGTKSDETLRPDRGPKRSQFRGRTSEIFGYLGPNGAGKTTTLRLILGLQRPTSGEVSIGGVRVVPHSAESVRARGRVGFLPGELGLYRDMTGQSLLDYFARFRPRQVPPWRSRLLEAFQLDASILKRRVKLLSHGTRQRIGLVIAMQHQADLLLLDEPTLGLDPLMRRAFAEIIKEIARAGVTIVFSSHVLAEVEDLCERVAMLRAGKLVVLQPIAHLRETMVRHMTVRFAIPPPDLRAVAGVVRVTMDGTEASLVLRGDINPLMKVLAGCQIERLVFPEPDLGEIFGEYYRGPGDESTRQAV